MTTMALAEARNQLLKLAAERRRGWDVSSSTQPAPPRSAAGDTDDRGGLDSSDAVRGLKRSPSAQPRLQGHARSWASLARWKR
jgi:hypothetical protein